MTSFVMPPPYDSADPAGQPALGAILFHDFDGSREAEAMAAGRQRAAPWCPACLRIGPGAESSAVEFVYETLAMPGVVPTGPSQCLPTAAMLLQAVDRRRAPDVEAIVDYVVRRLGCFQLRDVLLDAVGHGAGDGGHPRTVRRRLGALGRLRPWEWRRLGGLASLTHRAEATLDALAARAGTEPRTLRRWIRGLLGVTTGAYRRWPGWEWIVEAGLRRGGYLDTPAAIPSLAVFTTRSPDSLAECADASIPARADLRHPRLDGPCAAIVSPAGRG